MWKPFHIYIQQFCSEAAWGHPYSTYAKFSEKITFLTPCAYQGVRNANFSENFAYVLNGWPPCRRCCSGFLRKTLEA